MAQSNDAPCYIHNFSEPGSGQFGRCRWEQNTSNIATVQDVILKAVETIPVRSTGSVFTIAEYGCADGASSMYLIRSIIDQVRKHPERTTASIQVIYEDLPSNDFLSLFNRLHGVIPEPRTYLKDFTDVFTLASGTEFFSAVMSPESIDVAVSFGSVLYLSKPVTKFKDSLQRFPNATAEEKQLVEAQAAKDWETFLLQRARELKSGGILCVGMAAEDPQGSQNGVRACMQGFEEAMLAVWRSMRDEGKITQEEFMDTNFHRCMKYLEECQAPFVDSRSAVRQAGLHLVTAQQVLVPCVARAAWKSRLDKEGIDDRDAWLNNIIQQHRVWTNGPFTHALSSTRAREEKEALVNELYKRLEVEIGRQGPDKFMSDYLMNFVLARKL